MNERVRQAELARRLDVSRQAIGDLVARGVLAVGADGLIDLAEAETAIAAAVHPASKTSAAMRAQPTRDGHDSTNSEPQKPPAIDYHAARTLREFTEAQRAALKLRQELGELAPLASIERQLAAAVIAAREYLRTEPPRLAVLLDGLDRQGREAILAKTFDEFLRRLADWKPTPAHADDT